MAPRTHVLSLLQSSKMIQTAKNAHGNRPNGIGVADAIGGIVRPVC